MPAASASLGASAVAGSILGDRYAILCELASGGMASVLYGRLRGPVGFARPVAIKRLHPHIAREPDFVSMFIDEARICARLSHVNIVSTLDVIEVPSELCLVMEYVHGAALDMLLDACRARALAIPVRIAVGLMIGVLHGLHAAHEARDEQGHPLHIVHRDVSPQNVLVGEEGVARVLDFGIAKAVGKLRSTPSGEVKGKLAYMAPEQFRGVPVDRRVDIHGAGAVLWEMLAGRPLFEGESESAVVHRVLSEDPPPPSAERAQAADPVSQGLDAIVLRALAREPEARFASAREMANALEREVHGASQSELSEWVRSLVGTWLDARAAELRRLQQNQDQGADPGAARGAAASTRRLPPHPTKIARVSPEELAEGSTLRRRRPLAFFAGVLVILALAGALLWLRPARFGLAPRAATQPSRAEPVAPAATSNRSSDSRAVDQTESAARASSAVAGEPVPPRSSSRVDGGPEPLPAAPPVRERVHKAHTKRPQQGARATQPQPPCSPPYWWSADGVKHYKRECL